MKENDEAGPNTQYETDEADQMKENDEAGPNVQ